jgi:molybdopterin synthase sulfur carrier subunit
MTIVNVRYFASIREALGPGEQVELPAGGTVWALRDALIERSSVHAATLARGRALRCAMDQVVCEETAAVHEGAEVAFFPPVTGG